MDLRRTIETLAEQLAHGILAALRAAPLREVLELVGDGEPSRAPRTASAPRIAGKPARRRAPSPTRRSPKVRRVELEILSVLRSGASFLRDEIAAALAPAHRRLLNEALAGLVERGAVTQIVAEGGDARDALYVAGDARKSG